MAGAAFGTAYRHLRDLFAAGSVVGLEDGALLARYSRSNDPAAFEALVSRHGPMVLATCRAVLRNEQDVEDAFQATFLVLARKAGSVRGGDALGGWLHRVAYRASVQASVQERRRRKSEAEASAMSPSDATSPIRDVDGELRPILHEEVDRLPDRHRLPVVLCDLEGLTYEQAAEQLRWTVPALRCRLAKARQKLKGRLTRRGVSPLAIAPLAASKPATALVPPALLRATVLAATGGPVSSGVVLLTHTLLKGMLMTKLKIAGTASLAALALVSAGVIAAGAGRPEVPQPEPEPQSETLATVGQTPPALKPVETVEVKGRVVAPDGRPIAGASVRGAYVDRQSRPLPEAISDPEGRFAIRLPKPANSGGVSAAYSARFPWLVASAPGFGLGWTEGALRADRPAETEVKLVEGGSPIEGRIIDLEGRAVAGARIRLSRVWFDAKGDLAGWIARARNGAASNLWQGLENLPLDEILRLEAKTGPDGRFSLAGVGEGRVADLLVSGTGVATTEIHALSGPEAEIRAVDRHMMNREPFIVQARQFQLALAPSKPVEGIARDQDTGRPIVGLKINAAVFDERSMIWAPGIEATTDSEGRYRLDGLPKADAYRLFFDPAAGLPYTKATLKAPANSPALEPVAFDFSLKPGVLVRGRVLDKLTGRPVQGYANYYAMEDNPNVDQYPGFRRGYTSQAYINQEDGTFELVGLPGRGLIGVRAEEDRHKGAVVAEGTPGYDAKMTAFRTVPRYCTIGNYHVITPVDLDPKAEPVKLELQADPGRSATIEVVGLDGQPVGGTTVRGRSELFQSIASPEPSSGFEVHSLDPAKPRRIIVAHDARKLIGSALLKGDEAGPVVIRLVPWGTVAGRIVDDEGKPRKAMFIGSPTGNQRLHPETDDIVPGTDWNNGIPVGNDGLFRVEGLVPGLRYSTNARAGFDAGGDLFVNLTLAPGEVKELGDLKVQPPKKED